jgi:hypothetical protein
MRQLHDCKNHDYAKIDDPLSNLKLMALLDFLPAWKSVVVRLGDKFSRLVEFAKKETLKVKDESLLDTCLDLANYALLCAVLYEEGDLK